MDSQADPSDVDRPAPSPAAAAPLSSRLCDRLVLLFAVWTLCCHALVLAGGSFSSLLLVVGAVTVATAAALIIRRRGSPALEPPASPSGPVAQHPEPRGLTVRGIGLLLGLGGLGLFSVHQELLPLWWWIVLLLAGAAVITSGERSRLPPPIRQPRRELLLWGLGLACVALALAVHRPDADDSLYVNMAVAAADAPHQPLLRWDTLHGIPDLPLHFPLYRVHSYELLNGALSYLSGIPAIYCFHLVAAALAALLLPLAHARLFRLLEPRHWLWAVAALLVIHLAVGYPHRWYGNFGLVRIWQGKSIFLSVLLPLIYAYALELAVRPSRRRWLLLASAQIAAVGLTSSALWAAPVASLSALLAAGPWRRGGIRRLALGAGASAYVFVLAALMKVSVLGEVVVRSLVPGREVSLSRQLQGIVWPVIGGYPLLTVSLAAPLLAWTVCRRPLARRFAILVPLVACLLTVNPYTDQWIKANLTGPSIWRGLWALPVPILLALLAVAPLGLDGGAARRWSGRGASLLLLLAFAALVPAYGGLSPKNRNLQIGWPGLKVPPGEYAAAAALSAAVPAGSHVAGPAAVTAWVTTIHGHPFPLEVRNYLRIQHRRLGAAELETRRRVTTSLEGRSEETETLGGLLDRYEVQGVCLLTRNQGTELQATLRRAGFRYRQTISSYEIWARP